MLQWRRIMEQIAKNLLDDFSPALPLAEAATAPASWYTNAEFYALESRASLKANWQFVAPLALLAEPGQYHTGNFLGEPYLILRDESGELKAFFNVCRHHAACLLEGDGRTEKISCPYHGWTYDLNGGLQKAPGLGAVRNFKKEDMGMVPIPLAVQGPFVLLNFSKDPSPPPPRADLYSRLEKSGYGNLQFHSRRQYVIQCNWKVYVDNYLDGGYHVGVLHKGLASQLALENYALENFSDWTLQRCGGASDRIGEEALYAWLHPNFMINRYGPVMDTNWVVPLGVDRCVTIFDYYFARGTGADFIENSLAASEKVQAEDIAISESVQRGLSSSAYGKGRYSVAHESGMHLFHQWLHRDLSR